MTEGPVNVEVHLTFEVHDADDWRLILTSLSRQGPITFDVDGLPDDWRPGLL